MDVTRLFNGTRLQILRPVEGLTPSWAGWAGAGVSDVIGASDYICSICEDQSRWKIVISLACGHRFHKVCINKWLRRTGRCPSCSQIEELPLHESSSDDFDTSTLEAQMMGRRRFPDQISHCVSEEENELLSSITDLQLHEDGEVDVIEDTNEVLVRDICSVCFEELQQTLTLTLPCSHSFHYECLCRWLNERRNCPMCRAHVAVFEQAGYFAYLFEELMAFLELTPFAIVCVVIVLIFHFCRVFVNRFL
ncbi:hypothetical protein AVEN_198546-1 [Araneus ventricosus]|uniref:RING-type domain-containing protein n=1 Tax=Araneus ventricosus TaxID=182803 RepID=A0A4Y2HX11_ARAVE|nr:hypothetical protein AVEN_198546-1 [Araneus ventricosus]